MPPIGRQMSADVIFSALFLPGIYTVSNIKKYSHGGMLLPHFDARSLLNENLSVDTRHALSPLLRIFINISGPGLSTPKPLRQMGGLAAAK